MQTKSRPHLQCKKIKNLLTRYILVSTRHECSLAYRIICEIEQALPSGDRGFDFPPVDVDDARNVLAAFMKYINTTQDSREMDEMMSLPFYTVYHNTSIYLPDDVVPMLEALLNRTWRILEEEKLKPQERMLSAFEYAGNALSSFW